MQQKICATCFYDKGTCEILTTKIPKNCFAWADEAEAKKREKAIKNYNEEALPNAMTDEQKEARRLKTEQNRKARGGKAPYDLLNENYLVLQGQGMTVTEIANELKIDRNRVYDYVSKYDLPLPNKKSRHVGA